MRSCHVAGRSDERGLLQELGRHGGGRLLLAALEVEVLDQLGLLLVAVAPDEGVVEVAVPRPHAPDVQGGHPPGQLPQVLEALADGHQAAGGHLQRAELGDPAGPVRRPAPSPTPRPPSRG